MSLSCGLQYCEYIGLLRTNSIHDYMNALLDDYVAMNALLDDYVAMNALLDDYVAMNALLDYYVAM